MKSHLSELFVGDQKSVRVGQIIYRINGEQVEILLVRSFTPGYDNGFDFPKGGKHKNETDEEGSAREVLEETGLRTKIVADLGSEEYFKTKLHLFLAKYESGGLDFEGNAIGGDYENDIKRFFNFELALKMINPKRKNFLLKAKKEIKRIEGIEE